MRVEVCAGAEAKAKAKANAEERRGNAGERKGQRRARANAGVLRYSIPLRVRMTGGKEDATAFVVGDLVPDDLGGRAGVEGRRTEANISGRGGLR